MLPTADDPRSHFPPADDATPARIGRYRILERLGAGGMGTVYKAHDPHLDRVVAIKAPHFDGPPHSLAQRMQRFQREARAAARVWHARVCPIFDVGEEDGRPYVVMGYIEGRSLEQRLAEQGRFEDVGEAVALVLQVLDGLAAVHAAGLVHRDLKPGNILLDATGAAFITDFGLARPEQGGEHLTSDGVVLGTPHYMAPEQAAGQSERIGPCTDLYGVGVVFYRVLTGKLPFEGPVLAVLSKILHNPVPPPSKWRPGLDTILEAVVLKALAREPAGRYADAVAFAEALRGCVAQAVPPTPAYANAPEPRSAGATATLLPTVVRGRPARPRFWKRWKLLLLIAVGLLAVGIPTAWVMIYRDQMRYADASHRPANVEEAVLGLGGIGVAVIGLCVGVAALYWKLALRPRAMLFWAGIDHGEYYLPELLRAGVPVNCTDETGETPLMKAAQAGQLAVAKLLLLHGADVRLKNRFGQTALMIAAAKGHADVFQLLKQAGATE